MKYLYEVLNKIKQQNSPKFYEAVSSFFESIDFYIQENEEFLKKNSILEKLTIADKIIKFRVDWIDDEGKRRVNNGYRVEFNNALGVYKGGLRFSKFVNEDTLKFLGFEQTFKNALTDLPMGGAKGGSDFDPKDKSENEIMNFCKAFMTKLFRHIGAYTDVPAGDIGVSSREIGYLYGQYKLLSNLNEGVLTGKSLNYGGLKGRSEATGYGLIYFINYFLKKNNEDLKSKTVLVSGSGNVSIYAIEKLKELGAVVLTASDSNGYIYDKDGIDIDILKEIKLKKRLRIKEYIKYKKDANYYENQKPWNNKADIALPCATENDIDLVDAKNLLKNGIKYIAEGANMPCNNEAKKYILENKIIFLPAKAANAGGVSSSLMEMSQNSNFIPWDFNKSDEELKNIMQNIAKNIYEESQKSKIDYMTSANLISFKKVVSAIIEQGI